jgi:hypothetical protein
MAYLSDQTGSNVPSPGNAQCPTGLLGGNIPADGPNTSCRLIMDVTNDGAGVTTAMEAAVWSILDGAALEVHAVASPGDQVERVEVATSGQDVLVPGQPCATLDVAQTTDRWTGPEGLVAGQDGVVDTAQVRARTKVCFHVAPVTNTTLAPTTQPQVFLVPRSLRGRPRANTPVDVSLGTAVTVALVVRAAP